MHKKLKPASSQAMPYGSHLDPRTWHSGRLLTKLDFVLEICFSVSSQKAGSGGNLCPLCLYDRNIFSLCATVYQAAMEMSTEEHEMISKVNCTRIINPEFLNVLCAYKSLTLCGWRGAHESALQSALLVALIHLIFRESPDF